MWWNKSTASKYRRGSPQMSISQRLRGNPEDVRRRQTVFTQGPSSISFLYWSLYRTVKSTSFFFVEDETFLAKRASCNYQYYYTNTSTTQLSMSYLQSGENKHMNTSRVHRIKSGGWLLRCFTCLVEVTESHSLHNAIFRLSLHRFTFMRCTLLLSCLIDRFYSPPLSSWLPSFGSYKARRASTWVYARDFVSPRTMYMVQNP